MGAGHGWEPSKGGSRARTGAEQQQPGVAPEMKPSYLQDVPEMFAFKRRATVHLDRLLEELMRGPSPLGPGLRELIGAFTSRENECRF